MGQARYIDGLVTLAAASGDARHLDAAQAWLSGFWRTQRRDGPLAWGLGFEWQGGDGQGPYTVTTALRRSDRFDAPLMGAVGDERRRRSSSSSTGA